MIDEIVLFGNPVMLNGQLIALISVVFVAGVIRGFAGFGSAMLTVPVLSVLHEPAHAVAIAMLLEIPVSLSLLPTAVREAERQTVWPMLSMFVVFVPVGAMLLNAIDPQLMKIGVSVLVLLMVGLLALQDRFTQLMSSRLTSRGGTLLTGAIAGTSQGMTGVAGPLFATALLARG